MAKGKNTLFLNRNKKEYALQTESDKYKKKVIYKYFPDPAKMMPKVCFSKKGIKIFKPEEKIIEIYKQGTFKKGNEFNQEDMQALINFFKKCLKEYEGWKHYDFTNIKATDKYTTISEFYTDVAKDGYKIEFEKIAQKYLEEKNETGELYLFEIYNKDLSPNAKGRKNLHTLYFEALFSETNKELNFPIKLDGEAELFFRPLTPKEKLTKKQDKKGNEIINHKRYASNKIFLHMPITINRTAQNVKKYNIKIQKILANREEINIIGIDRGEKHLAYYTVINQKGDIIESDSLNNVNGIDYYKLLEEKAKNRLKERQDWNEIEKIKDLKKGYISHVIAKIAKLALQYNAIIVLEDLNTRFKQIRGGIEKTTYQQLEKALIEKLNYLVLKTEENLKKAGSVYHGYQLTAPFEGFNKMKKQSGIIFYTQAAYTSKIDPITGWMPNIYIKYKNAKEAKDQILKFKDIEYYDDAFHFTYDVRDFTNAEKHPLKTIWTISSCVERYRWEKSQSNNVGEYKYYQNITKNIKELFEKYGIKYQSGDIKNEIKAIEEKGNENFFKELIDYIKLITQIRNTNPNGATDGEKDFIYSPVAPYFDSRKKYNKRLPENGDENGSYNIARKGIIILKKISQHAIKKPNFETEAALTIAKEEWDNFTQCNIN